MSSFNKIPMFSKEEFDDWKIRMHAHLAVQDDDMWYVITDGPMKIMKANTVVALIDGAPHLEKPRDEWISEDKRKANLDNVAKDILYKTLDKNTFSKIKIYKKKLSVDVQKFDNIKMKAGESISDFDERVSTIVNELNALGRVHSNKEIALKVMYGLPKE
ncbi:uncharacterized protein [Primulina huaijiensis]|uniref:uncharacterized protein n=1 Tax=Primulina huaijiensis TaxID=1492673 RepID=UPI003CC7068C